jgi:hypothetical protein
LLANKAQSVVITHNLQGSYHGTYGPGMIGLVVITHNLQGGYHIKFPYVLYYLGRNYTQFTS